MFCRLRFFAVLVLTLVLSSCEKPERRHQKVIPAGARFTFAEWQRACEELSNNRDANGVLPDKQFLPLTDFATMLREIEAFYEQQATGPLSESSCWLGSPPAEDSFFEIDKWKFRTRVFQPYAQRLKLPHGSQVRFFGDLHGDVHSLVAQLMRLNAEGVMEGFKVVHPDTTLVFLGDYTDRGVYGVEVIYTLLRLKLANPDQVVLARGNHEDIALNERYGFDAECVHKFGATGLAFGRILRIYDFLPVVVYVGSGDDYLQCNHGGIEPGYDPSQLLEARSEKQFQLLGTLKRKQFSDRHPEAFSEFASLPTAARVAAETAQEKWFIDHEPMGLRNPTVLGFVWNDFTVFQSDPLDWQDGRSWLVSQSMTKTALEFASSNSVTLRAVIRAHQHTAMETPLMKRLITHQGLFRHWQEIGKKGERALTVQQLRSKLQASREGMPLQNGSVYTLNVSPDSVYGSRLSYNFATHGLLTMDGPFEQWRIEAVTTVPKVLKD